MLKYKVSLVLLQTIITFALVIKQTTKDGTHS